MRLQVLNDKLIASELSSAERSWLFGAGFRKVPKQRDYYFKDPNWSIWVKIVNAGLSVEGSAEVKQICAKARTLNFRRIDIVKKVLEIMSSDIISLPNNYIYPPGITLTVTQLKALSILAIRPTLLLALDMGLGKTVTLLTHIINMCQKEHKKHLIVAPARVIMVFGEEFEKYYPDFFSKHVCLLNKTGKKNKELLYSSWQVAVCSYDMMKALFDELIKIPFKGIYFDECHYLANSSNRTKKAHELLQVVNPLSRVAMSGTIGTTKPPEFSIKRLSDLVTNFAFEETRFTKWRDSWCYAEEATHYTTYVFNEIRREEFEKRLAPYILRRELKDEAPHIKETRFGTIYAPLNKVAMDVYKDLKEKYISTLLVTTPTGNISAYFAEGWHTLKRLMLLNMVCSGYFRDENGKLHNIHTEKFKAAKEFTENIPLDKQVIFVCTYRESYTLLKDTFKDNIEVIGLLTDKNKTKAIKDFKDRKLQYLGIHPRAGGTGLNFSNCSYVVWIEPTYSGTDWAQTNSRILRLDTKGATHVYSILSIDVTGEKLIDSIMRDTAMGKVETQAEFYQRLIEQQHA